MEEKLGRGLSALLGNELGSINRDESSNVSFVDIDMLIPNKNQPRKAFKPEQLQELSASISTSGILQPITVRKNNTNYEIIAGERRWRAAKIAGLSTVPIYEIER